MSLVLNVLSPFLMFSLLDLRSRPPSPFDGDIKVELHGLTHFFRPEYPLRFLGGGDRSVGLFPRVLLETFRWYRSSVLEGFYYRRKVKTKGLETFKEGHHL